VALCIVNELRICIMLVQLRDDACIMLDMIIVVQLIYDTNGWNC
jgi:hypothetical protein